jgi:short-subunit dehydrogenase
MSEKRPVALITGASAGIGAALAQVFADGGHELVLVARRADKLNALADTIAQSGRPRPIVLAADLGTGAVAERIGEELAKRDLEPQYVVNNAGFGLIGRAEALARAEQVAMVDLNVRTLVDMSLAFTDSLVRHRGGLLNVASIAGFLPGPGMAVYYASKAFVVSFTDALHAEFVPLGVRVTALCPGPVPTEFQERAGIPQEYANPPLAACSPSYVARAGYRGLMAGRRRVVPGFVNKIVTEVPRFLPSGVLLKMMAAMQLRRFGEVRDRDARSASLS